MQSLQKRAVSGRLRLRWAWLGSLAPVSYSYCNAISSITVSFYQHQGARCATHSIARLWFLVEMLSLLPR